MVIIRWNWNGSEPAALAAERLADRRPAAGLGGATAVIATSPPVRSRRARRPGRRGRARRRVRRGAPRSRGPRGWGRAASTWVRRTPSATSPAIEVGDAAQTVDVHPGRCSGVALVGDDAAASWRRGRAGRGTRRRAAPPRRARSARLSSSGDTGDQRGAGLHHHDVVGQALGLGQEVGAHHDGAAVRRSCRG